MSAVDHEVIVVGAGPTGLLLAALLADAGVDVAVWEARRETSPGSRAIGIHPPVLAALEASGITERILAHAARVTTGVARAGGRTLGVVRFDRLSSRFGFVATAPQAHTEAALAGMTPVRRGRRVRSVRDRGTHVDVLADEAGRVSVSTARIVVLASGAGGRALAPAPMAVHAHTYPDRYLMADVDDPSGRFADTAVITLDAAGVVESFPLPGALGDSGTGASGPPVLGTGASGTGATMRRRLVARIADSDHRHGDPAGVLAHAVDARTGEEELAGAIADSPVSSFGIRRVLARRMRVGRVVAIGDLAHEVSPIGGQGMNLGLLDAATLAPVLVRWLAAGVPGAGLARWERDRLASARTAARLAGLNTALGRPRGTVGQALASAALGVALRPPLGTIPTRAYAMGFDRSAALSRAPSP